MTTTLETVGQSITIDNKNEQNDILTPLQLLFTKFDISNPKIIILKAMTGSGKSTSLPVYMLTRYPKINIAMTQPRIANVEAIQKRINFLLENNENKQVKRNRSGSVSSKGHDVNKSDRLVIYTEGSYNIYKKDDWIIFDEAHERATVADILLSQLIVNKDKKIIITSATIDPNEYINYLTNNGYKKQDIMVAEIEGVKPEYNDPIFLNDNVDNYIDEAINIIVNNELYKNNEKRNILVFLPSVNIIKLMKQNLGFKLDSLYSNTNIVELYRNNINLDLIEENMINIILSTNVAETGVTFDNLKYVIDSGWTNNSYYNPENNVDMLFKGKITDNMAKQRWGRVGRSLIDKKDPSKGKIKGVIYCLYTKDFYEKEIKYFKGYPTILVNRVDDIILKIIEKQENMNLITDIIPQNRQRSIENLYLLWAIDENKQITELGKMMLEMGMEPRWAKIILASIANNCVYPIVAAISFIITQTSIVNMPRMFNSNFSDHWEYWLLFKNYFKSDALSSVLNQFIRIINKLEYLGFQINNDIEDSHDLWNRFKQSIYSGLYMNMARQSETDPNVYISNMNPEVMGRVGNSVIFTKNISIAFPKKIVFDTALLSHNSIGMAEYKFLNVTKAD